MYISESAFEEAEEKEFRRKVDEIKQYKQGIRYTKDGDWTEKDLVDDITDELHKVIEVWKKQHEYRLKKDETILFPEPLLEFIISSVDEWDTIIDAYNLYNDIGDFEKEIISKANVILRSNLVTQ